MLIFTQVKNAIFGRSVLICTILCASSSECRVSPKLYCYERQNGSFRDSCPQLLLIYTNTVNEPFNKIFFLCIFLLLLLVKYSMLSADIFNFNYIPVDLLKTLHLVIQQVKSEPLLQKTPGLSIHPSIHQQSISPSSIHHPSIHNYLVLYLKQL